MPLVRVSFDNRGNKSALHLLFVNILARIDPVAAIDRHASPTDSPSLPDNDHRNRHFLHRSRANTIDDISIVFSNPGRISNQLDVKPAEKLAYATYLASTIEIPPPDDRDRFFVAARMLVYQILHDPETRTERSIPMVVLVDPGVCQSKRDRLERDGAKVIPVNYLRPETDWLKPHKVRWKDMMVKLRLWELEEYSRVLFIDSDTIMKRSLDAIFDEQGARPRPSRFNVTIRSDEAPIPAEYVMAGVLEVPRNHSYPPLVTEFYSLSIFNGGFFVCSPSRVLFQYYVSALSIPERFDSDLMEMALLNYAHRLDGPMPWSRIPSSWSIRNPNQRDVDGGVASVHERWWKADEFKLDRELGDWFQEVRWKMHGFHVGRDAQVELQSVARTRQSP